MSLSPLLSGYEALTSLEISCRDPLKPISKLFRDQTDVTHAGVSAVEVPVTCLGVLSPTRG